MMTTHKMGRIAIIGLEVFGVVSTAIGSIGLLTGKLPTPEGLLDGTPFGSFTVPALLLGLVVGGTQLVALYATLRRAEWATMATGFAGCTMLGWIIGEILILGSDPGTMRNLQVVCGLDGLLEVMLATLQVRAGRTYAV